MPGVFLQNIQSFHKSRVLTPAFLACSVFLGAQLDTTEMETPPMQLLDATTNCYILLEAPNRGSTEGTETISHTTVIVYQQLIAQF